MVAVLGPKQIVAAAAVALLLAWGVSEAPGWIEKYRNGQLHLPFTNGSFTCSPGTKIRIAPEQDQVEAPQIWGDWVVWFRTIGNTLTNPNYPAHVYAYHIPTGEVRALALGNDLQTVPQIYGTTVVWRDESDDAIQLKATDLATQRFWTLNISMRANLAPRGIYENRVLVQVTAEDPSLTGLYVYDLRAERLAERITDYPPGVTEIWKDNVVWVKDPPQGQQGDSQLMLHNLSTGETRVLVESDLDLSQPDIYENVVVYMKGSAPGNKGDWDIYMLDLATNEETPIAVNTTGRAVQQSPRVAGDWVVYKEAGGYFGSGQTFAYHIPSRKLVPLEGSIRFTDVEPDVWQNRVASTEFFPKDKRINVIVVCLPETP